MSRIYTTSLALIAGIMVLGTACVGRCRPAHGPVYRECRDHLPGGRALRIISLGFVLSSVSVASTGALEGLSMGGPSLVITALRYVVVIIPIAFLLSRVWDAQGVWWAFPVTEALTAALSYFVYRRAARPAVETVA